MLQSDNGRRSESPQPRTPAARRSMDLWRRALKKLFADRMFEGLTADQNMAILEALEIGIVADGEVTDEELRLLRSDVWKLPWAWNQQDSEIEELLQASSRRLDALRQDEDDLLDCTERIVDRIPDGPVREAVYEMMVELSTVDGAGDWERDILEVFRRKAGLTKEKAAAIAAKFRERVTFG